MHVKSLISALMLTLLMVTTVVPRPRMVKDSAIDNQTPEVDKEVKSKALQLLDVVIKDTETLKLPENRAWLQANIAAVLWRYDETRAHNLFKEALNNLDAFINGDRPEDQEGNAKQLNTELRDEVLQLIAQYDLLLARDFLHRADASSLTEDDFQLGFKMLVQGAANNPQQALRLAEQSLSQKISYQLPELIRQLRVKDTSAATELVNAIVLRLRVENLSSDGEAASVACELLRILSEPTKAASETLAQNSRLTISPQVLRALSEMAASAALQRSLNDPDLLLQLQPVLPQIEQYAPTLAPEVRRKLTTLTRNFNPQKSSNSLADAKPVETVADDSNRLPAKEERAMELIQKVRTSALNGETTPSLELLEEAGRLLNINDKARNRPQLEARFELACAYALFDSSRSTVIFEAVIDRINDLATATVMADGFLTDSMEPLTRNDELILKTVSLFVNGREYTKALSLLAGAAFERTKEITDRCQPPELRIMLRLLVAQSVLADK
jgi:hypothetical protein